MNSNFGVVYTPKEYARILADWSINNPYEIILDLGVGQGMITFQAIERLINIGADKKTASSQIFGSEINKEIYNKFIEEAKSRNYNLRNVSNQDFFDYEFPDVDVIIGNPPYVRRRNFSTDEIEQIKIKTSNNNNSIDIEKISSLSDLYIYFLLYALPKLKPGGKLGLLISDTWLNARYGEVLKEYLITHFNIIELISVDRRIFHNAQVKALILLATKKNNVEEIDTTTRILRLKNGIDIEDFTSFIIDGITPDKKEAFVDFRDLTRLEIKSPWSMIFRQTKLIEEICNKPIITKVSEIADLHIGLQTLAKDFFIIPNKDHKNLPVEEEYLYPIAYSTSEFNDPIININRIPNYYIFLCSKPKSEIRNSNAFQYIVSNENKNIQIKGKDKIVQGYQNKERIKRANRKFWYDLESNFNITKVAEILIPRFIYKKFMILWNKAHYIPGGALIQFFPKNPNDYDIRVYLAILSSKFSEIIFRMRSQIYGGGSTNIRITDLRDSPTINISKLSSEQLETLQNSYDKYLETGNRDCIDNEIFKILCINEKQQIELDNLLDDLINTATSAKKIAHPSLE